MDIFCRRHFLYLRKTLQEEAVRLYIVAYDIADPKRLARVRKVAYSYAFGGQKSAVESYLDPKSLQKLLKELHPLIDHDTDRINVIRVSPKAILLGKATRLSFDKGAILL